MVSSGGGVGIQMKHSIQLRCQNRGLMKGRREVTEEASSTLAHAALVEKGMVPAVSDDGESPENGSRLCIHGDLPGNTKGERRWGTALIVYVRALPKLRI